MEKLTDSEKIDLLALRLHDLEKQIGYGSLSSTNDKLDRVASRLNISLMLVMFTVVMWAMPKLIKSYDSNVEAKD